MVSERLALRTSYSLVSNCNLAKLQFGIRAVCSKDPRLDFSIEIKHRAIGIQKYFCLCMYILSIK
jgi:hypothetical protein